MTMSKRALVGDWTSALASEQATDIEVCGVLGEGDEAMKAHRLVLAVRSPVFRGMLQSSPMRESQQDHRICLDGVDQAIVRCFVKFLYTEEVDQETLRNQDAVCHLLSL